MKFEQKIDLEISGLGIIMYSDFAVSHISEGEDYLTTKYQTVEQVLSHIYKGTIVGFCTGTSGKFILKFKSGYPEDDILNLYEYKLRLAIVVKERRIYIRDLYDLMDWTMQCSEEQSIEVENGIYHLTLCSNIPKSGVLGDDQEIYVYLMKVDDIPILKYSGVPMLCKV